MSDILEETKKIKEQLQQGIAEAENSIKKSKEYLAKNGYDLDSKDLQTMLEDSADAKIKQRYTEYREELQREIEQEQTRLQQLHSSSPSGGSVPRRKPDGIKI